MMTLKTTHIPIYSQPISATTSCLKGCQPTMQEIYWTSVCANAGAHSVPSRSYSDGGLSSWTDSFTYSTLRPQLPNCGLLLCISIIRKLNQRIYNSQKVSNPPTTKNFKFKSLVSVWNNNLLNDISLFSYSGQQQYQKPVQQFKVFNIIITLSQALMIETNTKRMVKRFAK